MNLEFYNFGGALIATGTRFTYVIFVHRSTGKITPSVRPFNPLTKEATDADVAFLKEVESFEEGIEACQNWENYTQY